MHVVVQRIEDRLQRDNRCGRAGISGRRIGAGRIDGEHLRGPRRFRQQVGERREGRQQSIGVDAGEKRGAGRIELGRESVGARDDLGDVDAAIFAHRRQCRFELVVDAHDILARRMARLADERLQRHRDCFELGESERIGLLDVVAMRLDVEQRHARGVDHFGDQRRRHRASKAGLGRTREPRGDDALGQQDR